MLSKKSTAESSSSKIGVLRNKKKKSEASYDFSNTQDEIRAQAYYNYLKRIKNNMPGDEMADWLDAEIRVQSKMSTH